MNDGHRLIFQCLKSQIANSSRFTPVPEFCKISVDKKSGEKLATETCDMKIFEEAIIELDECDEKKTDPKENTNAYKLLQFIKNTPIVLKCSEMKVGKKTVAFYKVEHSADIEDAFLIPSKESSLLFHGSSITNWHSIIHNGLKVMSNTKFMTTGAVHGTGIYLSDSIRMSYGYSAGGRQDQDLGIIIGVYEVYDAKKYKKITNIYVVPSEKLLVLRYLIRADQNDSAIFNDDTFQAYFEDLSVRAHKQRVRDAVNGLKCIEADAKELKLTKVNAFEYKVNYRSTSTRGENISKICTKTIKFSYSYPYNAPKINGVKVDPWNVEQRREILKKILDN